MSTIDQRVVNLDELKLEHFEQGESFAAGSVRIGPLIGAKDLGYSYDVVPPGNVAAWTHPPFAGEIVDGTLYGRGAVDMKGGIASAVAAV